VLLNQIPSSMLRCRDASFRFRSAMALPTNAFPLCTQRSSPRRLDGASICQLLQKEKAGVFLKKSGGGNSLQRALLELTSVFLSHPFFSLLAPSSLPGESFLSRFLGSLRSSCARLK